MTAFAHVDYPSEHPGVIRAERFVNNVQTISGRFDGARAGASMLLAAIVAALVVVANQVVDTWTDGHLLAAWIVMWAVAFAALALLAAPIKRLFATARAKSRDLSAANQQRAADEQVWNAALADARVMAGVSRSMSAVAKRGGPVWAGGDY